MKEQNVLVVSDHLEFAQNVMGRWHSERNVPSFTMMSSQVYRSQVDSCDLIIAGAINPQHTASLVASLEEARPQAILVTSDDLSTARARSSRIMLLREQDGWLDLLMLLAPECLRRVEASERAQRVEAILAESSNHATLGRYMLEMRHGLNNALTSVLGNAELLLLQPESFSEEVQEQLATIRSMSLRMNEILARFSSLELELNFAKREASGEVVAINRSRAAGYTSF